MTCNWKSSTGPVSVLYIVSTGTGPLLLLLLLLRHDDLCFPTVHFLTPNFTLVFRKDVRWALTLPLLLGVKKEEPPQCHLSILWCTFSAEGATD